MHVRMTNIKAACVACSAFVSRKHRPLAPRHRLITLLHSSNNNNNNNNSSNGNDANGWVQWSVASCAAAGISYADRGTSAIVASSLISELKWSESEVGDVQSCFFIGYALTQLLGGVLGGATHNNQANQLNQANDNNNKQVSNNNNRYRSIVALSLLLTAMTTILFPYCAEIGGPGLASLNRFALGIFEGLLLPAAMAGISDTTNNIITSTNANSNVNNKATASSILIAGCYLGSAFAYFSAFLLFSPQFSFSPHWQSIFYLNGILSIFILYFFQNQFQLSFHQNNNIFHSDANTLSNNLFHSLSNTFSDTIAVIKATLSSTSGRAIIVAQIGQGALLYTLSSWGPLYLERVADPSIHTVPSTTSVNIDANTNPSITTTTTITTIQAAGNAAYALILPQFTQALVGITIGTSADALSNASGSVKYTRRTLQLLSGVIPAILLWLLGEWGQSGDNSFNNVIITPANLFGLVQTVSALSLGGVSVSHLEVASKRDAGAVYAMGNVAAAVSGSLVVSLFGRLLEPIEIPSEIPSNVPIAVDDQVKINQAIVDQSLSSPFELPFKVVAILSSLGSLYYASTVGDELEIVVNSTRVK